MNYVNYVNTDILPTYHPTMASFMESLWGSVFTAGPNASLILATNATFAALQLLLGALFLATYSIHFAILSVLSAGLWGSINWFAAELGRAQGIEEEAERLREQQRKKSGGDKNAQAGAGVEDSADDEGESTETEALGMRESGSSAAYEPLEARGVFQDEKTRDDGVGSAATGLHVSDAYGTPRQRKVDEGDRSGEVSSSTDSEWEKVDGDR